MKKTIFFLLLLFFTINLRAATLPNGFVETLVAQNLDPTDMVIAPDGRIFIVIKSGRILIVENGVLLPEPFLNIESQVDNYNERGLGHMVLDTDFEINQHYYIYYTVAGENRNRVSRFTATGNFTVPGSEEVLLNMNVMAGTIHNAGAMVFGLDGKLYIATGDGADANTSQMKNSLLGKVLRINKDGTIPDDNPFVSDATYTGINKSIWALGFRNPFSMGIDPVTGKIYSNDVGGSAFEEVNEILMGRNYGWPMIEGMRTNQTAPPNYQDPVYAYPHGGGLNAGCAIVGSAFYNYTQFPSTAFPAAYHGRYFFADYCNGYIRMINPANGSLIPEAFATNINRPVAIRTAPDGSLYYLARAGMGGGSEQDNTSTSNGTLWRVVFSGSGEPIVSVQPQNILIPVGEDATFALAASGNQPFSYQWQEDETDISGATDASYTISNVQLSDDGRQFRCVVTNAAGTAISQTVTLSVTTNTRPNDPVIILTLPDNATLYRAGDLLQISGSATDAEDGVLAAGSLAWKIDFHHDEHTHPALGWTSGQTNLAYQIPIVGETSDNVWLRVYLRATDSEGLTNTSYVEIFPMKADVTLQTNPPGLNIKLDGTEFSTPHTFTSVVSQLRNVEAITSQTLGTSLYVFQEWEEESTPSFSFQVPDNGVSYTATYTSIPLGDGIGLQGNYYTNQNKTFSGNPTHTRIDPVIDFNWGGGSPHASISPDNFTVRWFGEVMAPVTGTYTFHVVADDGIRLWVNHQNLIDRWIDQGPTEWTGSITLQGQQKYPIRIEYYENGGGAVIQLFWSSELLPRQIIPTSQLSVDFITSVENPAGSEFRLYPTVADDKIMVEMSRPQPTDFVIYNLIGQQVGSGVLNNKVSVIEIGLLPVGMYVFKTATQDRKSIRFIKR